MMDFVINGEELAVMSGLPHIQQLTYLRGIRPYMDVKTGITGIKRRISYQSISEQLYIEPHQGIKSQSFSRDQVRRAVSGLVRAGMIEVQSDGMQLILKCPLASKHFSVQNKAAINPPQKATKNPHDTIHIDSGFPGFEALEADIARSPKAATPHKEDNYIYLLSQFEKFWSLYPEKKSKSNAQAVFQQINPDTTLFNKMLQALTAQINHREIAQSKGAWVPPWKYPATWLTKRSWEDELTTDVIQEKQHAEPKASTRKRDTAADMFCPPSDADDEPAKSNVIQLKRYL